MSHQINLKVNTFEPTRVDVMQASEAPEMIFLFDDDTMGVPIAGGTLYVRDPFGITTGYSLTKKTGMNALYFYPDPETFLEPGNNKGVIDCTDGTTWYSFPIVFTVVKNPALTQYRRGLPEHTLAPGASETLQGPVLAVGGKVIVQIAGGAYTLTDGAQLDIEDLRISFATTTYPQTAVTIENTGANTIGVPEIVVTAWTPISSGQNPADPDYVPSEYRPPGYFDGAAGVVKQLNGGTVSRASGTSWKTVQTFSVSPGAWAVTVSCGFASNATGRRAMCVSTTEDGSQAGYNVLDAENAVNGGYTVLQRTFFLNVVTETTYYLNVYQNSGSALNCYPRVHMIKIA